ncbi:hypothetical protein HA466_0289870 [Hirschfeldia incana]|nr:hypothetical protein HA466_0289870 [Hirschfeldia incana]
MWKKGELVWVRLNPSDSWIPGRILDPSEPFGILVSFFDLMEPRYVPKPCLRSFERCFETLIADSWRFRHFVNRALQTHFWNISFGLWCSCQSPIDSPYLDRGYSLLLSLPPLTSDSALGYVRDMAVSQRLPSLQRLVETNSSTAQILSFRRYTVDFKRSESLYEQVIESARLMDRAEEPDWYLDSSNDMVCIDLFPPIFHETTEPDLSLGGPVPKDIPCYSSSEQPVDKLVQSCTLKLRYPLNNSDSSLMKACETMARTSDHEDAERSKRCHWDQSICLPNSEYSIEDVIEEDTPSIGTLDDGSDVRTVTSAKQLSPLLDATNGKAFLAKPVSFVVLEDCKNLACSNKELASSDYVGVAPAEKLQDLEVATAFKDKIREVDNIISIGVKRKASRDKASGNSKRGNKASQESISADKPKNLQLLKDKPFADPKCLRMEFLSTHGNLPSKSELLKRFSVFGKLDASRTDVNPGESSAKVVFLQSIDAVTAYQFVKKIKLGRSKVVYRLGAFEEDIGVNMNI